MTQADSVGAETMEQIVTRLAPLYKERNIVQAELQKLTLRLDKVAQEISSLEARLRDYAGDSVTQPR